MNRRSRHIVLAGIGILLAGLATALAGCQAIGGGGTTLKVGFVGPLTGNFASIGTSWDNGISVMKAEIEQANKDVKVEYIPQDDAGKCEQSLNATTKLIESDKVHAIIGAINSPCALAMVPVTAKAQVPQFTGGVGTTITEQGSKWVFRVSPSAKSQTKDLANYVITKMGLKKIGIMYTNDEYGKSAGTGMQDAMKVLGATPAIFETWTLGDKDFSGQLNKLKASGAEALFATGSPTDAVLIAKQMRQMGMDKVRLLGDTGMANPDYIKLGGEAIEGAIILEPFTSTATDERTQRLIRSVKEKYNRDADWNAALSYDTLGMIYEAVKQTGKPDRKAIRDYVAGLKPGGNTYKGIMGNMAFDDTGDSQYSIYKIEIKGGQKVVLAR